MDDPFDTRGIRERVLAGWNASAARFREDANAEEDHVLGGYRDRLVVELAQNAADAAGTAGRVRFSLRGDVLTVANTGAPLDAAGVEALSTLRASAKRDEPSIGRFGVGFAAVVAVTDTPSIVSRTGGVAWSAERTREAVARDPALAAELARREGRVPLLRLPFPAEAAAIPEGYDTAVRLPLRDGPAEELVRRLLAEAGPALMLALPALAEVVIEMDGTARTLTAAWDDAGPADEPRPEGTARSGVVIDGTRWRTVEAAGVVDAGLLADRPVEERAGWQVRWAVPTDGMAEVPQVVYAPTPSDEPLGLPALLLASFPLAPDRRHVAPGALTDFLVERAAEAYLEVLPPTPRLLDLVPGPMAKGELDAKIRRAIVDRLPDTPLLPGPEPDDAGPWARVRGRDAVAVDGPAALVEVLAEVVPGLLPVGWNARHPGLATLGVRRMGPGDVVEALGGLEREPEWWRALYAALEGVDREALGGLPVPLADGRTVRGPRGLLITDPAGLEPLNLRIVHPAAVHPLLVRLGAIEAGPRAVLASDATRAAVAASFEDEDPEPIGHAVLTLVGKAHLRPGEEPWLAELALPDVDGELYPAGELLFPDAPLREVMDEDTPFGVVAGELIERYGAETLEATGVLRTFGLVRAEDVTDPDFHLDGEQEWADDLGDGFVVPEFTAVRDLELVADWPRALKLLAEPPLRAALTEPAHVILADGRRGRVPSYTAWWLARQPILDGRRPADLALGDELAGLYDPAPPGLDVELAKAIGIRTSIRQVPPEELLDRLADPARTVTRDRLRELWRTLADEDLELPEYVRALVDGEPEVVPASDAIVVDRPDLLPLLTGQPLIFVAVPDLAHATDEIPGEIESSGTVRAVPDVVRAVLPDAPETYVHHEPLLVDGQEVSWRCTDVVHAADLDGLARGLAWITGRWPDRLLAAAVLREPERLAVLLAEADLF